MKLYDGKIPFHPTTGELMHYPERLHLAGKPVSLDWRENKPFTAAMIVADTRRGRSAAYFILTEIGTEREFPMFITDMLAMLRHVVIRGGLVQGQWAACKRGTNYGLVYVP